MGTEWQLITPDGPWRDGCLESLIKSTKKAISCNIRDQILSITEFQTVYFEATNLVNERPISWHRKKPEDRAYLSHNHLLLGKASSRIPPGLFKELTNLKHRFEFFQELLTSFGEVLQRISFQIFWYIQNGTQRNATLKWEA